MTSPDGDTAEAGSEREPSSASDELVEVLQQALRSAEELGRELLLQARTNVDLAREKVEDRVESTVSGLLLVLFGATLVVSIAVLLARGLAASLGAALGSPGAGDLAAAAVLATLAVLALVLRRRVRRARRLAGLRAKYEPSDERCDGESA